MRNHEHRHYRSAAGYVELSGMDLVLTEGFVDERLLSHELESEQGERREEDGAGGAQGTVLATVLETNAAGKGACVDGVACKI